MISTPSFVFGAKSQKQCVMAAQLLWYCKEEGQTTTPGNIQWAMFMKNFATQWKALEDKKKGDECEVPKITKALPVIKWTEVVRDYLHHMIGVRIIPLTYKIWHKKDVPAIGRTIQLKTSLSHEHPTQAKKRTDCPGNNKHDHADVSDTAGKEVKVSAFPQYHIQDPTSSVLALPAFTVISCNVKLKSKEFWWVFSKLMARKR
jgi:hypothetical protein